VVYAFVSLSVCDCMLCEKTAEQIEMLYKTGSQEEGMDILIDGIRIRHRREVRCSGEFVRIHYKV